MIRTLAGSTLRGTQGGPFKRRKRTRFLPACAEKLTTPLAGTGHAWSPDLVTDR